MSKGADFSRLGVRLRKGVYIFSKIIFAFNSAAYYVLWLKFLQVVLVPFDLFISWIEHRRLKKQINKNIPVIFVVGIQRTGSTLVSQFIEKNFSFFPIGNFNSIFKRSNYYIHRWLAKVYKRPNPSYQNFYGISKGFFSIGDCYELWDRWFGKNHYIIPDSISDEQETDMQEFFTSLYSAYKRPLLTKNNRNSLLLPLFEDNFKNAFFVVVKRDPVAVIRSTIKASKDFFGDESLLWGLYPSADFDTSNYENIIEAATVQFLMLEQILNKQLEKLDKSSYLLVDYNNFCANPSGFQEDLIKRLSEKEGYDVKSVQLRTEPFRVSNRLNNSELDQQIKGYLKKWHDKI